MSENARERIAAIVADAKGTPTLTMREWEQGVDDATDHIIAIVCDALLSEEAIVAAVYAGMTHRPNTPSHYRATTEAQLAAAGLADTTKEQGESLNYKEMFTDAEPITVRDDLGEFQIHRDRLDDIGTITEQRLEHWEKYGKLDDWRLP